MGFEQAFQDIPLDALSNTSSQMKKEGWRCVQMLATTTDNGIDLTYSFYKDGRMVNYQIRGIDEHDKVPSIQGDFIGVFPFENEAHDLFGVTIEGMVLDFAGQFYQVSGNEPMTIITPEMKQRREKAAQKAAAAAAKAQGDASEPAPAPSKPLTPEEIDARVAKVAPEKQAKVRAALEAKARKEAAMGKVGE